MGNDEITVQILREIRDTIVSTNAATNERIDQTNGRLDLVVRGQMRMANDLELLRGEMRELRDEVGTLGGEVKTLGGEVKRLGARFEHFLETAGTSNRDLDARVRRLEETVYSRT